MTTFMEMNDLFYPPARMILHLDMDAFYTSVEQADNPELRGHPVVIGRSERGVISAASYEARVFGVHSAMPVAQARKLCPQAVFLPGRMERYREVSAQIMHILRQTCPVVEQTSVDEAFADISGTGRVLGQPETVARTLKADIWAQSGLTCSIGLAPNKFLAKIASDWNKPNGLTRILPQDVPAFLEALPLSKIPGVGPRLLTQLQALGAGTVLQIQARPRQYWIETLGKRGAVLYDRAHGIDHAPVLPHVEPQSCSAEHTLDQDTLDRQLLEHWLLAQAERVGRELRAHGKKALTVTLKVKFHDFTALTRNQTLAQPTDMTSEIYAAVRTLLAREKLAKPVRLIGTGASNFQQGQTQLPLMPDQRRIRNQALDQAMDHIRDKYGAGSILRADATVQKTQGTDDLLGQKNHRGKVNED